MNPVVIAVAITGSVPRKKDNPAVPTTPAEQVESTHEAYGAGASLVHIHVRNPDESPSSDPALFAQVQGGVRKHCPGMIVQFSTGGRGRDPAARGNALELRPDMASLSTGSVNFPTIVYENSAALVTDLATKMRDNGVRPEIEVFDLSHIHGARRSRTARSSPGNASRRLPSRRRSGPDPRRASRRRCGRGRAPVRRRPRRPRGCSRSARAR